MRSLLLIGVLLLGGCATKPTGNEYGGLVMQGQTHPDKAFKDAQEHCQQFGKSAKLTNREVSQKSEDPVMFECVGRGYADRGDRYSERDHDRDRN